MKSAEDIKKYFQKSTLSTNPDRHEAVYEKIQRAQNQSGAKTPELSGLNLRSKIMKNPTVKLAAAAVIIALVVLGLFEFIGTENSSGVVWANVVRKVEASQGSVVRCRETSSFLPSDPTDYSIAHTTPRYSRKDFYTAGQITHTHYSDFSDSDIVTFTGVYHKHKHYIFGTYPNSKDEVFLEQHEDWTNPRYLVQRILSCEHRELEQKTIEGVLCEGLETTDPAVYGPIPGSVTLLDVQMQLWVNVETQYPVMFEWKVSAEAEGEAAVESEGVMNQFQWDVELDESMFEPEIPADYIDISP
ncbi:MAG TPA: hypothetical protein HPP51_06210 [Planctomycetes bacterium]|nr:hypothetical protein [Planctomycetota bacterium]